MVIVRELKLFLIILKVCVLGWERLCTVQSYSFIYEGVWCHVDDLTTLRSTIFSREYRI